MSESFAYDGLNRLTSATVNLSPAPQVKIFAYSAIGNMLSKSDVGTYSYPAAGSPLPHAVMNVSGGSISSTFTYDANGNQTAGQGRSIVYTSYNKPASITQGTRTISFLDDSEHQRFKQVTPEGSTLYIAAFGVLAEVQNPGTTTQKWTEYLSVGNAKVGMRVIQTASATLSTRYFLTDHLGSISVLTDENGNVVERLSFDAWGKRRNADGTDDVTGSITSQTTRGFTGEEELSVGSLVHLNGRVYDALLARFTSADPTVTDPMNMQGWNRYSYVGNDPLAFTDPNGFSWLSSFFHSITNFFRNNPIARAILQIGATVLLNVVLPGLGFAGVALAAASAAGGAAIATGLSGGNLGQILKSAVIAGATAAAFYEVGSLTYGEAHASPAFDSPKFSAANYVENVAGHALVGCASSVASGGSCKSGALSAAVGSAAGPLMTDMNFGARLVTNTVLGGVASVAGGGKFANGAITGAFGYLFNECKADCFRRALSMARDMTFDWATGSGPSDRYFGPGTDQVNDLMDSPGVERARNYFYSKNAAGGQLQDVTNYAARFGLSGLVAAGTSPIAQFVGSFGVDITPVASEDADYLRFTVTNNSSMRSFAHGIGPAYERSTFGPGGNMRQTYEWYEQRR
jgi:RHS repeat-associated protein